MSTRSDQSREQGAAAAPAARPSRWEDHADRYRSDWEARYGQERPWMDHEGAYRYGWEAAQDARYHGKEFTEVETDLAHDYTEPGRGYFGGRDKDAAWAAAPPSRRDEESLEQAREAAGRAEGSAWDAFKDTVREGWERARRGFETRF
jgi:hypothetical protein